MEPLRIGILGASRIAPDALFAPAAATGDTLVAVAARDRAKADRYASEHAISRVLDDYQTLIHDPEVEVVYNALPNGLHGPWNIEALKAGKHVLSEKPSASTAAEAQKVRAVQATTGALFMEAFHYRYHPVMERIVELATSGEIGALKNVDIVMGFPLDQPDDPRWDFQLAGGSLMDVGCYALHAIRTLSAALGGTPHVTSSSAVPYGGHEHVDAELSADLLLNDDVTGHFHSSFLLPETTFTLLLEGSAGTAFAHNFCKPGLDDRISLTRGDEVTVEKHGDRSSYTYQLEAFGRHVREGVPIHTDVEDALAQAILIDDCYTAAGMPLRPETTLS